MKLSSMQRHVAKLISCVQTACQYNIVIVSKQLEQRTMKFKRKVLLTFILVLQTCIGLKLQLQIDVDDVIHTVDPYSPSVAMGLGIFERRWVDYFKDAKFMALARGLGASYLRVGGTKADVTTFITEATTARLRNSAWNLTFCSSAQRDDHSFQRHKVWADQQLLLYDLRKQQHGLQRAIVPVSFNASDWEKLNEFCSCAGWKLIFDLNLLKRNGSRWNYTNAQQLIKFTENRYHVNWELGNEPNSYKHKMGLYISPEQVGEGFNQLRKLLQASPWWESSIIVGPDINRVGKFSAGNYLTRSIRNISLKYWLKVIFFLV
ncbi:heparanase-like [Ciona intestinalis]